jgi:hypothetical protein
MWVMSGPRQPAWMGPVGLRKRTSSDGCAIVCEVPIADLEELTPAGNCLNWLGGLTNFGSWKCLNAKNGHSRNCFA